MRITSYDLEVEDFKYSLVKTNAVNYKCERLDNPKTICDMMCDLFNLHKKSEEHFYILGLNSTLRPTGIFLISKGTPESTPVCRRSLFARLLLSGSSVFIAVHNHPSGSLKPSKEDTALTKELRDSAEIFNIRLIDHVIVSCYETYLSFKQEGYAEFLS